MSTHPHQDADRETLSALVDGELRGDAARFALKRLDHDAQWRDACGRWQLAGDALRGQATVAAPMGFADRVGAALAHERAAASPTGTAIHHAQAGPPGAMPMRRRWVGGAALAASVAVAAVFVTRPFFQPNVLPVPAPQVATSAQPVAPMIGGTDAIAAQQAPAAASSVPPSSTRPGPALPAVEIGPAAAAVAVADAPRRASQSGARDPGQSAATGSPQGRIDHSMTVAAAPVVIAGTADGMPAGLESLATHPFQPQGEIVSRPWPRAVLSNYPAGSAFTASFDRTHASPGSSSFYPFEPRMLDPDRSPEAGPDVSDWPRR